MTSSTTQPIRTIEQTLTVPVTSVVDVLVAGGGCAGVAAAIAAARGGAKVMLIEPLLALGGQMTSGLMTTVSQATRDVPKIMGEMVERLLSKGLAIPGSPQFRRHPNPPTMIGIDPEGAKMLLSDMATEAGVQVLLGSMVVGGVVDGSTVIAAIIENKSGRQAITADVFIDATGDGDLAAHAGACFAVGRAEDGYGSAATLTFTIGGVDLETLVGYAETQPDQANGFAPHEIREAVFGRPRRFCKIQCFESLVRQVAETRAFSDWELRVLTQRGGPSFCPMPIDGQCQVNRTRITHLTGLDAKALSDSVAEGRRQVACLFDFMRTYIPGCANAYILETANLLGVRESRRIVGDYELSEKDIDGLARHDDVIVRTYDGLEIHNPTGTGTLDTEIPAGEWYDVPYRAIVVKGLENCFVAGRCYSATHEALSAARSIGVCMALGEAAGRAAAMACAQGVTIRDVSMPELQIALGL